MKEAAYKIKSGELVAFPTETVYGLGANAYNEDAVRKIYSAKGRPSNNPLIVHIANIETAREIAHFNNESEILAKHFWPGPITFVLPIKENSKIAPSVRAGLDTIAIRMPAHKIAMELLEKSEVPIAAPSANPSGYISATLASHIRSNLPEIYVLEDPDEKNMGVNNYGLESTIVDLSDPDNVKILRYGFITPEILSNVLGRPVEYIEDMEIKAPGMLEKHYSPKSKIRLNATSLEEYEIGLGFFEYNLSEEFNLSKSGNLEEAAKNLYNMLQLIDAYPGEKTIAIAPIPNVGIGLAINDRLKRASSS